MKHSERFTKAVTKLYNAFHAGELEALDCGACAVGNICNNSTAWPNAGKFYDNSFSYASPSQTRYAKQVIERSGYSIEELIQVELLFIEAASLSVVVESKESQFKGLCAVIEYLCELEGIPNIMDYTCLFETADDQPKHQLQEVFN